MFSETNKLFNLILAVMISNNIFAQVNACITEETHVHSAGGVIFSGFPLHQEDYAADVQEIMDETIIRYGEDEWKSVVLTGEFHGHLGVYAIIGTKMGLLARELMNAGQDELEITSFAGLKPPISCLNDGLQTSTGSTLGHGLIKVQDTTTPVPAASFRYCDQILKISLKISQQEDISKEIKEIFDRNVGLTPGYWQEIRVLGLDIWSNFDRREIFDTEIIHNPQD